MDKSPEELASEKLAAELHAAEHAEKMRLTEEQVNGIRKEIEEECPLIGDDQPLEFLQVEYAGNEPFLMKIQEMGKRYTHYRKTRRDGSCFYRAFLYRVFELIITHDDKKLRDQLLEKVKGCASFLKQAGFEGVVFSDVQDLFVEKLQSLKPDMKTQELVEMFRTPDISNYLVLMLRFLTSSQLRNNAVLYETFIDNGMPIEMFCQTEVEPIDKEADQIQIMALLTYLDVAIRIVYLDGNLTSIQPTSMTIPEDAKGPIGIVLLYRPGHYDILYGEH